MLLTLSPFEPFKQNFSACAPQVADLHDLLPDSMVGHSSSALLPHATSAASSPLPRATLATSSQLKRKRSDDDDDETTPAKRQATDSDAAAKAGKPSSPDLEKKRNKLGYHRTSVACSHCRRRKIRCMIPDNDTTGRCANCIRLKKECNFCPVEESGTSRGARAQLPGHGSMQPPAGSPDPIVKATGMMPTPLQMQQRPPPYMNPGVMPPAMGIYDSPQSAIHNHPRWYPPPGWERPTGDDQPGNYGLSQQPLASPYSLPSATAQLSSHLSPDLNPHSEDSQVPHSAHPYPQLRSDMAWNAPTAQPSRSLSYAFPTAMSAPQLMDPSNVPRRAATLPGPVPNMPFVGSNTSAAGSEPVAMPPAPGGHPTSQHQQLEWQPIDWAISAQSKEQSYSSEPYTFGDPTGWYHHQG